MQFCRLRKIKDESIEISAVHLKRRKRNECDETEPHMKFLLFFVDNGLCALFDDNSPKHALNLIAQPLNFYNFIHM